MRRSGPAGIVAALLALAGSAAGAPPDSSSTPAASAALPDTLAPPRFTPVETGTVPASAPAEAARPGPALPDTSGFVARVDAARKRGEGSLADLLRTRRPVLVQTAPSFEPAFGAPSVPGGGEPIRPRPSPMPGDRATDRTVIAGIPYLVGVPALATAWAGPESEGIDPFDFVAIDSSLAPGPFRGAGELFARPEAVLYSAFAMPDAPRPYRVRSALYYRRGDGSLLDTAARFSSPLFARGIAGSYVRHAADALPPFAGSVSTRYHAAAAITRSGPLRSWVEGRLFQMRLEMDYPGGYRFFPPPEHGRAEWASRDAALHALWDVADLRVSGAIRVGQGKATRVGYGNGFLGTDGRERWRFPEADAELRVEGSADAWRWSLGGLGSTLRAEYRDDFGAFASRFGEARLTAGLRRSLRSAETGGTDGSGKSGEAGGIAADVAADAREGDAPFLDARVSFWAAGRRGRIRLDAESAHERPTSVDLLSPGRADTVLGAPQTLVFRRAGAPDLRARVLRGVLAAASFPAARGVDLLAFGSARRVTGDFGWNATRTESGDTIRIDDVAGARGSGWLWHAAGGIEAALGPLTARGVAWGRGESDGLSPRAGSPPRVGLDAMVGIRASFFQGDLPLELDVEAHATGPRRGLIEAPALATWDARLRADFGSAGIFGTLTNVFDRTVPSFVYEIDRDGGAPLPGRAFSIGVVWALLD